MKYAFSHDAMKTFEKLDSNTAGRIIKGIIGLPSKGQIKPLEGELSGQYRLRIGDWRIIIYEVVGNEVLVRKITSRGETYK